MKNLLVQYQGGGYSGCVWEWNFFYLDAGGKFHDIYSSGSGAITIPHTALDLIRGDGAFYVYDINCPTSLDEFAKNVHSILVAMVVRWFSENQDNEIYAICSKCNSKIFEWEELYDVDSDVLCDDCRSMNSCSYCGQYVDSEDGLFCSVEDIAKVWDVPEKIAHDIIDSYAPLCGYCCQDLLNEGLDKLMETKK